MAAQNQASNVDLFDVYFRRADLDRDGRISGQEAVAFFQAANLPKQVLAQIWMHADQNRIGFLGRAEFYNALKLVTVAQSKRELTPDIVKAALYGPAASKIPAPQINLSATNAPQLNSAAVTSAPQLGATPPTLPQNLGPRGPQVPPNPRTNQQFFPPQENQLIRPTQAIMGSAPRPTGVPLQGFSGGSIAPNSSVAPMGPTASLPPRPQPTSGMMPSVAPAKGSKAPVASGNGFPSDSVFGGDVFSATLSHPKQDDSAAKFSAGVSAGAQPSIRPTGQMPLDSLQSSLGMQPVGGLPQQDQSLMKQNQQVPTQGTSAFTSSGIPPAAVNSASTQPQLPWPKITQSDVQRYTKVFVEVDKDRDGKITGEEARNLFLSWRLPREVLKQVWDLSDQDNDSMLSLREFCSALYLMERYREGRPLPAELPSNIMLDLPTTGQPSARVGYSNVAWGSAPGLQQGLPPGARKMAASTRMGPAPVAGPQVDEVVQHNPQKSRVPVLEKHLVDQLSKEEQNTLTSKFQEATEADKKVEELEKEILDSKEKIGFYRTKMQEIILYKSRCDNRLNEITERTSVDKQEFDSLAKKYEEKCKQVGDVASKLTTEEATFRDIQERKMELYQAIVKMEQGDSADGVLQVRADRIQSDLDELVKSLNGRCKKYGLAVKPMTLTELPFGWQPGIEEGAADWDEDWDKFEDEGFTFVKELTLDVKNVVAPPKPKATSVVKETVESPTAASSLKTDVMSPKSPDTHERALPNGSAHNQSTEDSARSPVDSPVARSERESPSRDFSDSHFGKIADFDSSPHAKETLSDHGGTESIFSGDKNFDEPAWGTFDTNDDVDSVWGFNSISTTKEMDQESHREDYFFSSGGLDLGLNPIRTESSQADSSFQYKNTFNFDSVPSTPQYTSTFNFDSVPSTPQYTSTFNFDSVPSTPQYKSTFNINSVPSTPQYNSTQSFNSRFGGEASEEHSFDNFSRFDSFNSHDTGFFQQPDTLARFDSMRSTRDFDTGHSRTFSSFDDSDPFGSTGPFRTSLDNQTPRKGSDKWSAF